MEWLSDLILKLDTGLRRETYDVKVTFIKAMASYATWRATKVNGQFDAKTFEVKLNLYQP